MANHAFRRKRKFTDSLIKKLIVITAIVLSLLIVAAVVVSALYISNKSSGGAAYAGGDTAESLNVLVLAYGSDEAQAGAFMLLRIDSSDGKIYLTSLPTDTLCSYEDSRNTLNGHLSYGGHIQAMDAVENLLQIEIDRYARIELSAFEEAMDALGGVSFDVPEQVTQNSGAGLPINIAPGTQTLTGAMAGAVFTKSDWNTTDRITIQENLACAIINQYMKGSVLQNAQSSFNRVINSVETDISLMDLYRVLPSLNSMAAAEAPAEVRHAEGSYVSENGTPGFVISDSSLATLTAVYTDKE